MRKHARPDIDMDVARYYVYQATAADGRCLYVGRSYDPIGRLRSHHANTEWAREVAQLEAWGPYTWPTAHVYERRAIERLQPLHNVTHTHRAVTEYERAHSNSGRVRGKA